MKKFAIFILACLWPALMILTAPANAVTVNFSFDATIPFGGQTGTGGTITGTIFGLTDNATSSATDIVITSAPAAIIGLPSVPFSIFSDYVAYINSGGGPYTPVSVTLNSFTLSSGIVTAALFQVSGGYFDLNVADIYNELFNASYQGFQNMGGFNGITFSTATQTPLPAALPLFATGLGALGLLGWRRKRKNAAIAA